MIVRLSHDDDVLPILNFSKLSILHDKKVRTTVGPRTYNLSKMIYHHTKSQRKIFFSSKEIIVVQDGTSVVYAHNLYGKLEEDGLLVMVVVYLDSIHSLVHYIPISVPGYLLHRLISIHSA